MQLNSNILSVLISLLFIFSTTVYSGEKVKLKADKIFYRESSKELVASSNAFASYQDIKVQGPVLIVNTEENTLLGKGDVFITRDTEEIQAKRFFLDLDTNYLTVEEIKMSVDTFGNEDGIYIQADKLEDKDGFKTGYNGVVTTCSFDKPHYYMWAHDFQYYPEKRVVGQYVAVNNLNNWAGFNFTGLIQLPLLLVPFWTPTYVYELGERKVVYLMPIMGSNREEGSFYKNTIDYYFGNDNYGEVYFDIMSKKGLGLGTKHHYGLGDDIDGSLSYYKLTEQKDYSAEWDQAYRLNDELRFEHNIAARDSYLLSGSRSVSDSQSYDLIYDDLGDKHHLGYDFSRSRTSLTTKRYALNYDRYYNDRQEWDLDFSRNQTTVISETYSVSENHMLPHDFDLKNQLNFYRQEQGASSRLFDEKLNTTTTISKGFALGRGALTLTEFFDTDGDKFTGDVNTYVKKLPEFTFSFNSLSWELTDDRVSEDVTLSFNENLTFGTYEEAHIQSNGELRTFRASRYLFQQSSSLSFRNMPLNSAMTMNFGYDQYVYDTGHNTFKVSGSNTLTTDWWNFFKTDTTYTRAYVPAHGGSPFYFDDRDQLSQNQIAETFTFYKDSPDKYKLDLSTGYDFERKEQDDYRAGLYLNPNPRFSSSFNTGYRIREKTYDPLVSQLSYRFRDRFSLSLSANYDLNKGKVTQLSNTIMTKLGETWEDSWILNAYFTFQPTSHPDYRMDTLSIEKDLHCRKITISYNRLLEEIRFQFSINAFPEDKIDVSSNKNEDVKIEGVMDDSSKERF